MTPSGAWIRACFAGCLLFIGACADAAVPPTGEGLPQQEAWGDSVALDFVVRVGELDGPAERTFGRVGPVAIGPEEQILVADLMVPTIRVFDAAGQYLRSFGRAGQGPGEFVSVRGLHASHDGLVSVWDPQAGRMTVLGLDVEDVLATIPIDSRMGAPDALRVTRWGTYLVKAAVPPGPESPAGQCQGLVCVREGVVWLRYSAEGSLLDTLHAPPTRREGPALGLATLTGTIRAFPIETVSTVGPDGDLVWGRTDRYTFFRESGDGRIQEVSRGFVPLPVDRREKEEWRALLDFRGRQAEEVPDLKPAFRDLWVDEEGRVWVWRYVESVHVPDEVAARTGRPPVNWREPPTWDVFDLQGTFLGTVHLPMRARPVAARGRDLWLLEAGDFDEASVARYRIRSIR